MENTAEVTVQSERLVWSLAEAAKSLGVCTRTLKREVDLGRLKAFKIGRQWRIRFAELQAYLKRNEVRASS